METLSDAEVMQVSISLDLMTSRQRCPKHSFCCSCNFTVRLSFMQRSQVARCHTQTHTGIEDVCTALVSTLRSTITDLISRLVFLIRFSTVSKFECAQYSGMQLFRVFFSSDFLFSLIYAALTVYNYNHVKYAQDMLTGSCMPEYYKG